MNETCNSCKKRITNVNGTTRFKCPSCRQYEIIRCKSCRQRATKYRCPGCSFEGPN